MNAQQNVAPHAVEINTYKFEAEHGKMPRGIGQWGFCPRERYNANDYLDYVMWYTGSYAHAKKSARAYFSTKSGVSEVVVCP